MRKRCPLHEAMLEARRNAKTSAGNRALYRLGGLEAASLSNSGVNHFIPQTARTGAAAPCAHPQRHVT